MTGQVGGPRFNPYEAKGEIKLPREGKTQLPVRPRSEHIIAAGAAVHFDYFQKGGSGASVAPRAPLSGSRTPAAAAPKPVVSAASPSAQGSRLSELQSRTVDAAAPSLSQGVRPPVGSGERTPLAPQSAGFQSFHGARRV